MENVAAEIKKQGYASLIWSVVGLLFALEIPFHVYIMGIPIIAVVLGTFGLIRSRRALALISANPSENEFKQISTAGNIISIITLVIAGLIVVRNYAPIGF